MSPQGASSAAATSPQVASSAAATPPEGSLRCTDRQFPHLPRPPSSAFPPPSLSVPFAPEDSNLASMRNSGGSSGSTGGVSDGLPAGLGDQRGHQSVAPLTAFFLSAAPPLAAATPAPPSSGPSAPPWSASLDGGTQGGQGHSDDGDEYWRGQDDEHLGDADVAGWLAAAAAAGRESDASPLEFRPGMAATPVVSVQPRTMQGLLPFSGDRSRD